ncbi:MAG: hypothetical protein H6722_31620 [Sandaracinus sp.]|nr:hypothetical protein [Sandaracinus sp.]
MLTGAVIERTEARVAFHGDGFPEKARVRRLNTGSDVQGELLEKTRPFVAYTVDDPDTRVVEWVLLVSEGCADVPGPNPSSRSDRYASPPHHDVRLVLRDGGRLLGGRDFVVTTAAERERKRREEESSNKKYGKRHRKLGPKVEKAQR